MNGWILYRASDGELSSDDYEVLQFKKEAEQQNIKLRILTPDQFDIFITSDSNKSIVLDKEHVPLPNFVIPRRGSATPYYMLAVLRHLEKLGVYIINSSQAIEIVKDKMHTYQILAGSGMPIPKTMLVKDPIDIDFIEKSIGFPAIIKKLSGTHGKGVFLAENRDAFADLIDMMPDASFNFIVQEFIETSRGKDLRVFIVGGRVVGCMQRTAKGGNFKANYAIGGSVNRYELSPEIEWLATESARIVNLDVAGVDLLFEKSGHYKVCEINSAPEFKGLETCCNVNIAKEILDFTKIRLGTFA